MLKVDDVRTIYYDGIHRVSLVVFLHGGPGGGTTPTGRLNYFDPKAYRIIQLDQRKWSINSACMSKE